MTEIAPAIPVLSADLLLVHAPAVFDFCNRRDIYFPFLSTSGSVPVTPLYEYFPVGFKSLQAYLGARGHDVKLINLATVLLRYPTLEFDALARAWMRRSSASACTGWCIRRGRWPSQSASSGSAPTRH